MTIPAILLPVFVQVLLIFIILGWSGRARFGAAGRGEVRVSDIAVNDSAWPESVRKVGNSFNNQFQLPMLFFVLVILAIDTKKADLLFVILEWLFVLSRIVHAYIHCTSNVVQWRFRAFGFGLLVLMIMWIIFALRILIGF